MPGLTHLQPRRAPDWPPDTIGPGARPQQAKRATAYDSTEGKCNSATSAAHSEHTLETALKCHVLTNRAHGTAGHHRNSFFIRPKLPRTGGVVAFPNTGKQRELEKTRRQRHISPVKQQDKITSRGLNKTEISSMPAREFKAMVINSPYLRKE